MTDAPSVTLPRSHLTLNGGTLSVLTSFCSRLSVFFDLISRPSLVHWQEIQSITLGSVCERRTPVTIHTGYVKYYDYYV